MTDAKTAKLERALRATPDLGDLERATSALLDRAERESLIDVAYAELDSPFGTLMVAGTERGIVRVGLPNRDPEGWLEELAEMISPRILEAPARLDQARRELDAYFAGRLDRFQVPLDWRLMGEGFRGRAIRAITTIPYGETRTYGELAAEAGNPRAFRAAGTACGANPLPPIVPCHRVLPAGGGVGSYGGGPELKRELLRLEGALPG